MNAENSTNESENISEIGQLKRRLGTDSRAAELAIVLGLLLSWGISLSYIDASRTGRGLVFVWIAAFVWWHVLSGAGDRGTLLVRCRELRGDVSRNWALTIALTLIFFIAQPWVWAYEVDACQIHTEIGTRYPLVTLASAGVVAIIAKFGVFTIGYPLLEEHAFRKWLLRWMTDRYSIAASLLVTSALFAALHLRPEMFFFDFAFGVVLAIAAVRTGSIFTSFCIHFAANLSLLLMKLPGLQPLYTHFLRSSLFGCGSSLAVWIIAITASIFLLLGFTVSKRHDKDILMPLAQ